ncbi:hypothetical protein CBL_12250 [Carabus blaptoides fortunei]
MPSRYAVLKIEDDDFRPANSNKSKDKKKSDLKLNGKKVEKTGAAKKPAKQPAKPQQKKEKKKKEANEQWEQWKQKDSEFVDGNFEQDLHTAILQSKLDYEEKKDLYKLHKKEAEQEKRAIEIPNGKKKKNKAMSLEQFKNLVDANNESSQVKDDEESELVIVGEVDDDQFFERVQTETKEELHKELNKNQPKDIKKQRKSFNNDTITIAQLQEKLESLQLENIALREEVQNGKKEIITVKTRNKTLCGILASGEMKDKADVLMELDRLSRVRDELTEEVTRLHGLLEQERSKVGALTAEPHPHSKHKEKNKKRTASENIQQQ